MPTSSAPTSPPYPTARWVRLSTLTFPAQANRFLPMGRPWASAGTRLKCVLGSEHGSFDEVAQDKRMGDLNESPALVDSAELYGGQTQLVDQFCDLDHRLRENRSP